MRSPSLTHRRAKTLRRTLSPPEAALWVRLRERRASGPTFRRQHPIGPYIADFYCPAARLVIEIDGAGHAEAAQIEHDARRDTYMKGLDYHVIRCSAGEVMRDREGVAQGIVDAALALLALKG